MQKILKGFTKSVIKKSVFSLFYKELKVFNNNRKNLRFALAFFTYICYNIYNYIKVYATRSILKNNVS